MLEARVAAGTAIEVCYTSLFTFVDFDAPSGIKIGRNKLRKVQAAMGTAIEVCLYLVVHFCRF